MALARKLVSGETDNELVEDIFQQAQQVAAQGEQLLVDADWPRPAPESETLVSALPSDGEVAPVVELVPCANNHGQGEQQQSLFSWAEFLSDQADQPKPRSRNRRPSGPSLFDWALEREQGAELAAAGG